MADMIDTIMEHFDVKSFDVDAVVNEMMTNTDVEVDIDFEASED